MDFGGSALWVTGTWLGGFVNWWNTLNVGTLAESAAAFATFIAALVALGASQREVRRHKLAEGIALIESQREKVHAREAKVAAVSYRCTGHSMYGARFIIDNYSPFPIYGAKLIRESVGPFRDWVIAGTVDGNHIWECHSIPPGKSEICVLEDQRVRGSKWGRLCLVFFDVDQNQWMINSGGLLTHIGSSSILDYDFDQRIEKLRRECDPPRAKVWRWFLGRWQLARRVALSLWRGKRESGGAPGSTPAPTSPALSELAREPDPPGQGTAT